MKSPSRKNCHFVAKTTQTISEVLSTHFKLSKDAQSLLFSIGAIYKNKNRILENETLQPKDHLQIYLTPKRYPVERIDWKKLVIEENKQFLVINKPAGIPVHSTEDNLTENVLFQLRRTTQGELWVTHRLDTAVSGLMVLARTSHYQSDFNQLLKQRKVSKFYRALVEREPQRGLLKHFMSPEEKTPKKLSPEPIKGWLDCSLEILKVEPWNDSEGRAFWEIEIELLTGRTHQIRAQLSWSGSPILGDKMYRGRNRAGFTKSHLALHSSRLEWIDSSGKHKFEIEPNFKLI